MNTTITIKTDKKLRDAAKKTAKELGIPLTTVMNAHLREFVREKTFTVSAYPRVKDSVMEELREIIEDAKKNPKNVTTFETGEDFIASLKKRI